MESKATTAVPVNPVLRRSSRRKTRGSIRGPSIFALRPPPRIQSITTIQLSHFAMSFLAMAIRTSTAYGPKERRERDLLDYARAVVAQGISPNDDGQEEGSMSAVALAAYYGYSQLLRFLLVEGGCNAQGVLTAAVKNRQHECLQVLFQERRDEQAAQLHRESLASWPATSCTTMKIALCAGDVLTVRLLREHGAQVLILFQTDRKWIRVVQELHPDCNVLHWSRQVHWSFPGADRRMLNWMWHAVCHKQTTQPKDGGASLPTEIWLRVFGFIGRGWWSLSSVGDQNGWQDLAPSMRTS